MKWFIVKWKHHLHKNRWRKKSSRFEWVGGKELRFRHYEIVTEFDRGQLVNEVYEVEKSYSNDRDCPQVWRDRTSISRPPTYQTHTHTHTQKKKQINLHLHHSSQQRIPAPRRHDPSRFDSKSVAIHLAVMYWIASRQNHPVSQIPIFPQAIETRATLLATSRLWAP